MMNTITDFWQMIWNTNAGIIVSLYADEKSQVGEILMLNSFVWIFVYSRMCRIFGHCPIKLWIVEILAYVLLMNDSNVNISIEIFYSNQRRFVQYG